MVGLSQNSVTSSAVFSENHPFWCTSHSHPQSLSWMTSCNKIESTHSTHSKCTSDTSPIVDAILSLIQYNLEKTNIQSFRRIHHTGLNLQKKTQPTFASHLFLPSPLPSCCFCCFIILRYGNGPTSF